MYAFAVSSVVRSVVHRRRRLSTLLSVQPVFTRLASTSSKHPFPFPSHRHPTPHEIFHLPRSASQDEIKTRYYELVKVYHPDVTHGQRGVSPSVRSVRFRAITHAYDVLRGRHALSSEAPSSWDHHRSRDEAILAELRRRSRQSRSPSSTTTAGDVRHENTGDAQVWYALMAFMFVGIIAAMSSVTSHMDRVRRHTQSAAANLAQARAEAQLYGTERRRKIRERVRSFHGARETVYESGLPEMDDTSKVLLSREEMGLENVPKDGRT
ncbi:hypothetical protein JVT61DRAFT_441 [Boletus reticuloceps]|uniref:J domain-containing protein n=1 Tax=Boletus reticuloceps TaxID=495285 RepID=A0A8I2Z3H3_9AGAM|nr:hypothetical protein JVT61DRAFT_441 [Boletus reticuloceps]